MWPPLRAAAAESSVDDNEELVAHPCRKCRAARRSNHFIDAEAGVYEEAIADEDDFDADPTMGGFIADYYDLEKFYLLHSLIYSHV